MRHDNSITLFPATTVSSNKFRWLDSESWSDPELDYFRRRRGERLRGLYAPPSYFANPKKPHLQLAARWTLSTIAPPEEPVGWAELQWFSGTFIKGLMFCQVDSSASMPPAEAISLAVSAALVLGEFDQLRLVPELENLECCKGWGDDKTLYSPEGGSEITGVQSIDITPASWWKTPQGIRDSKILAYLKLRKKRHD